MSPLPSDRAQTVDTPAELLAIAGGLVHQAADLYHRLGERMKEIGNESAHAAFADLEALQRENAVQPPEGEDSDAPHVFLAESLDTTRRVTPYMAYSLGVRNQERAFAFWSHVSAHATNPTIRSEAERLGRAELDHVRELRAKRRLAYREHDEDRFAAERVRIASLTEFRQEAAGREAAQATLHGQIAAVLAVAKDPLADEVEAIAQEEAESARSLGLAQASERTDLPSGDPGNSLASAIDALETAAEFYLAVAERSDREDVVAAAQDLASRVVVRLTRLRG